MYDVAVQGVDVAERMMQFRMNALERYAPQLIHDVAEHAHQALRAALAGKATIANGLYIRHADMESYIGISEDVSRRLIWLMRGTRPHVIYPKNRKALRFMLNGREQFRGRVLHPGTKPSVNLAQTFMEIRGFAESSLKRMITASE